MVNVKALLDIVVDVLMTSADDNYVTEMRRLDEVEVVPLITAALERYSCFRV